MPITWNCTEQDHLSTSDQTPDEKTARRVFICVASERATSVDAEYAPGILRGAAHPKDSARKCRGIHPVCDPESHGIHWTVTFDYTDKPFQDQNPTDTPATYEWDGDDEKQPYFIDKSSTPKSVCTSAGERFTELLDRDAGSDTCQVSKFVLYSAYDPTINKTYRNAVNTDSFTMDGRTIAVGEAKIKKIPAGPKLTTTYTDGFGAQHTIDYREVKAIVQLREGGWEDKIEDRGFHEKSSGKLKEINKGTPPIKPDTPWPLDGSGAAKPNSTDTPSTLTFKPYKEVAFAPLGFA